MSRSSGLRSRAGIIARGASSRALTLALASALAACGGDTTDPNPPGGPGPGGGGGGGAGSLTGLWDASVSGIKGITPTGQQVSCTASWVMSIDSLAIYGPDPISTQLPYTTSIQCGTGAPGIWFERGRFFIVRQSGDSFAFLSASRLDTFFVAHRPTATTLTGRMADLSYRDAVFGAMRHAGTVDPNRAPFAFELAPPYLDAEIGDSVVMGTRVYDAYFAEVPNPTVQWSSSATGVAMIAGSGLIRGVSPGATTITGVLDTMVRSVTFTVLEPPASVAIVSAPDSLIDPATAYIQAEARDGQGQVLPDRRFEWSSSNPSVATVGEGGYLQTAGPGPVTITVRSRTATAPPSASVTFPVLPAIAGIDVGGVPPGGGLTIGSSAQLTAIPRDAQGNALSGRPISWTLDDFFGAMQLTPAGLVSAHRGGPGTVVLQVGDSTRRITITGLMDGRFMALAGGTGYTCGITTTGRIYCWGSSSEGRLGPAADAGPGALPLPSPETFVALEAGEAHTCALNGAGAAFCWGLDALGQLGRLGGAEGEVQAVAGGHAFTELTLGWQFTCGVTAAQAAWCWGANQLGQLGRGTTGTGANAAPALVAGSHAFTEVRAGSEHACGLTTAGEAWCWGGNYGGQLGLGTTDNVAHATPVHSAPGLTFSALAAGGSRTCGITSGGPVSCWGNFNGSPAEVANVSGIVRITGGTLGFCGLDAAGMMSCWGHLGPTIEYTPPGPVADFTVGAVHNCALPVTGKAFCWGFSLAGELGGEDQSTVDGPVVIIGQP